MGFGVASFWLLPRTPQYVPFLTSEEKRHISEVLQDDGVVATNASEDEFSWHHVIETFKKPHVLILAVAGFLNGKSSKVCRFDGSK